MSQHNEIGLIGLAVMGQNLARNLASRNIKTVVFNRTTKTTEDFIKAFGNENLVGETSLEAFVASIARPRKIILMVQAGGPVDAVIGQLLPLLEPGDIIIDGGNSHYPDTRRRKDELAVRDIHFVGCGISGGEEGALNGPSLMPGGDVLAVEAIMPYLQKIAAQDFAGNSCVTNVGEDGAGHYVKMVHNGIEYAVMQFLAEAYDLMRSAGMSPPAIADVFGRWNKGKLASYLIELSEVVLRKKDDQGGGFLIDTILDSAGQKGTGRWTVLDAVERAVALPAITAAVNARIFSGQKPLRERLEQSFAPKRAAPKIDEQALENALYISMISAYSEGFWLIRTAAKEMGWTIDFSELARIWQGGCIIRAELLRFLEENFRKNGSDAPLLTLPEIVAEVSGSLDDLRSTIAAGIEAGVPLPGLSAAHSHLEQMFRNRGSANFLQALRDAFGAHTFERVDKEGVFHAEWRDSISNVE